jgi:hypothetical protein
MIAGDTSLGSFVAFCENVTVATQIRQPRRADAGDFQVGQAFQPDSPKSQARKPDRAQCGCPDQRAGLWRRVRSLMKKTTTQNDQRELDGICDGRIPKATWGGVPIDGTDNFAPIIPSI